VKSCHKPKEKQSNFSKNDKKKVKSWHKRKEKGEKWKLGIQTVVMKPTQCTVEAYNPSDILINRRIFRIIRTTFHCFFSHSRENFTFFIKFDFFFSFWAQIHIFFLLSCKISLFFHLIIFLFVHIKRPFLFTHHPKKLLAPENTTVTITIKPPPHLLALILRLPVSPQRSMDSNWVVEFRWVWIKFSILHLFLHLYIKQFFSYFLKTWEFNFSNDYFSNSWYVAFWNLTFVWYEIKNERFRWDITDRFPIREIWEFRKFRFVFGFEGDDFRAKLLKRESSVFGFEIDRDGDFFRETGDFIILSKRINKQTKHFQTN